MKNKLLEKYPDSIFNKTKAKEVFIADFTKRTESQRGVEITEIQPFDPNDATRKMPCFMIANPNEQCIEYNVFDEKQFVDEDNNQLKQGECCFFHSKNDGRSWFAILEIKDCMPKRITEYKKNIAEKAESMFKIIRNVVGIPNTIYFIASFPRNKTCFNQAMFDDYIDMKKYKKAFLITSNKSTVIDNHIFDPYK